MKHRRPAVTAGGHEQVLEPERVPILQRDHGGMNSTARVRSCVTRFRRRMHGAE
ncbi:MAG: hypothetical protein ACYSVY_25395 [Planctomycetota bacterium]